jgi:hypothetical protein
VRHLTSPSFWACYHRLPEAVQQLADRNFALLKVNPRHPSLQFKTIRRYRSVRVGLHYRALAVEVPAGLLWFWIGSHSEYDQLLRVR